MKKNEKREKVLMRGSLCVRKALPHDLPLMAVMVQQIEGMRDIITEKHVWHLSDKAIKNVCKCKKNFSYSLRQLKMFCLQSGF